MFFQPLGQRRFHRPFGRERREPKIQLFGKTGRGDCRERDSEWQDTGELDEHVRVTPSNAGSFVQLTDDVVGNGTGLGFCLKKCSRNSRTKGICSRPFEREKSQVRAFTRAWATRLST